MLLGDLVLAVWVVLFGSKQGEVSVEIPLQFIVQNDAERPAAGASNAGRFFVIEAVQVGVVPCFARL